ncbi:MAG: ABC transporter permease, partial [Acidobacteriota bacterium]|nr:ABC transporter permease [Acidobacteriota bacterium]
PSGRAQSVPGTMTFTVLMMTLIYGAVFLTVEKKTGMLRRQVSLPLTRRQIFFGKLLGRLWIAAIQLAILIPVGRFVFGVSFGSSVAGLVLLVSAYALAVGGLATLMGAVLQTAEQAGMIGWIVGLVMAGLGGCWWPAEVTPRWMWRLAHVFPTAWAMDGFHALISFGHGVEAVLVPSAVLVGFGALFSVVGSRFLDLG